MPGPSDEPVAGSTHLHRAEIHKRIANRLRRTAGVVTVQSFPSAMRPIRVEATMDLGPFLTAADERGEATLEVEWRPRPDRDWFRIQFQKASASWSCGWHQDQTHEDLGPNHFQVDCNDWSSSYREPGAFHDSNPMAILEATLGELRARVPDLPGGVQ